MEPKKESKGSPSEPKGEQNTITNRCRKKVAKRIEKEETSATSFGTTSIKNQEEYHQQNHQQIYQQKT